MMGINGPGPGLGLDPFNRERWSSRQLTGITSRSETRQERIAREHREASFAWQAFLKMQSKLHEKYADRLMASSFSHEKKGSSLDSMIPKSTPAPSFPLAQNQIEEIDKFGQNIKNILDNYDSDDYDSDDDDPGIGVLGVRKNYLNLPSSIRKRIEIIQVNVGDINFIELNPLYMSVETAEKFYDEIRISLGPQIFSNYATAQQIFYNTESDFYWQFYSILLNVAQTYFQESLALGNEAQAFSRLDTFHKQSLESRELKVILETFVKTYGEAFPHFKDKARVFLNRLFNGNQLLNSLLETIEKTGEAYYESAPVMRGFLLPPPNNHDTVTEALYTSKTLQSFLDSKEKIRYQQFVSDYLKNYPEKISYFKEFFKLGDVSIEQIPEILATTSFQLPTIQLIKKIFNDFEHQWPNKFKKEFRMHGAFLYIHNSNINDWNDLKEIIFFYPPKNPADAIFRQEMLIYCSKSHDEERFYVLRRGLSEFFNGKSDSLLQAVYKETVLKKRFYEPSYRLLEIADRCMKIAPEKMAPFFEALPEKIAIFQPALFDEARNRSFLDLLWLGSAILANPNIKVVSKSETTSKDSFLSDGKPRFEEVDENGEPLNLVMNSKASFDEEEEEDEEMKTDEAALKATSELMPASALSKSQYQARQARQRELFQQILMQDESEYRSWHKIQKILRDEAEQYQNMPSRAETSLSWKLWHGGSQSKEFCVRLKETGNQIIDRPFRLIEEMGKLQKYFLKLSHSSLREGSQDTPIVIELDKLMEAMQDDALATLLREEMEQVSPNEALVASRQPFFIRTFPSWFPERRPRYLERSKLGLTFQRSTQVMQALVGTEENKEEFYQEANTSFNERIKAEVNRRLQEKDEAIAQLQQIQKKHEEELAQHKEAIIALQNEWNEWRGGLEKTTALVLNEIQALTQRVNMLDTLILSQSEINSLSEAVFFLQGAVNALGTQSGQYYQNNAKNQKSLSDLRKDLDDQQQQLQTLQIKLNTQTPQPSLLTPEETLYVEAFEKTMTGVYLAAYVISTGLFSVNASGNFGKSANIINFFANITPFAGGGMKILSALLQSADEKLLQVRMQRLQDLGGLLEVIALSKQLAIKLLGCLDLDNPVSDDMLTKILSTATDVVDALGGTFFQWVQDMGIDKITDALISRPSHATADRGEQDANLLITRVCGVPNKPSENMLLLYAAPLLPMADRLFIRILSLFCIAEHCEQNQITWNRQKQQTFYTHITQSFERHADDIEEQVINTVKRDEFLTNMANNYAGYTGSAPDGTTTTGIFYFKEQKGSPQVPGLSFFGQRGLLSKSNCGLREIPTLPNDWYDLLSLTRGMNSVYLYAKDDPTRLYYWVPKKNSRFNLLVASETRLTLYIEPQNQAAFTELLKNMPKKKCLSNADLKGMIALTVPLKPHASMHNDSLEANVADALVGRELKRR